MTTEEKPVYFAWDLYRTAVNDGNGKQRMSVGELNSLAVVAGSFIDALTAPSEIYPRGGDGKPKFPTKIYRGPVTDYDRKPVPVVGSLENTDIDNPTPEQKAAMAIVNALIPIAGETLVVSAATAPGGNLINTVHEHGIVFVTGTAANLAMPTEDPQHVVTMPASTPALAKLLFELEPVVSALSTQSTSGQNLSAVSSADVSARADIASNFSALEKNQQYRLKVAAGVGGVLLIGAALVRYTGKSKSSKSTELATRG